MKIDEIKTVIKNIIENRSEYHSVLIDGPWGCGKTSVIKDVIKELGESHCHIYYQSLFGVKDVVELRNCYKKAGLLKKIGKSFIPLFELVPIEGENIYKMLDRVLDSIPDQKARPQTDKIFIFDDFERIDTSFSYITLLGFFNQLILNGCTIICISSLGDLSKENTEENVKTRIREIELFKEKSFDRIFYINENPFNILIDLFNEFRIDGIYPLLIHFKNNIRLAKRTKRLYKELNQIEDMNLEKYFTKEQILKVCIAVSSCVYNRIDIKKETNEETKEIESYEYLANSESNKPLNDLVLYNLMSYSKHEKIFLPEEKEKLYILAKDIAMYEVHGDKTSLIESYPKDSKNNKTRSLLDVSDYYYFDDYEKESFYKEFKAKTLDESLKIDKRYIDILSQIWRYYSPSLKDDEFNKFIINKISADCVKGNKDGYSRLNDYLIANESKDFLDFLKEVLHEINEIIHRETITQIEKRIDNCIKTGDYSYLCTFVEDIASYKYSDKKYICDWFDTHLLKKDFLIPDLSKTINQPMWQYCHSISRYAVANIELKDRLCSLLKQEYSKHPDSESSKSRISYLLKQYFGISGLNSLI